MIITVDKVEILGGHLDIWDKTNAKLIRVTDKDEPQPGIMVIAKDDVCWYYSNVAFSCKKKLTPEDAAKVIRRGWLDFSIFNGGGNNE
jgi:hypothetical protein